MTRFWPTWASLLFFSCTFTFSKEGAQCNPSFYAADCALGGDPVRFFVPDLIHGDMGITWIYVLGPALDAIIAMGFEWILQA